MKIENKPTALHQYILQWGMKKLPFGEEMQEEPCWNAQTRKARDWLDRIAELKGIMVLSGGHGTGKSYLLGWWSGQLESKRYCPVIVTQATLTGSGLFGAILLKLGSDPSLHKSRNLERFEKVLEGLGKRTLIVILDEAQGYSDEALEEIRLLHGLNLEKGSRFSLILSGDKSLLKKLQMRVNQALTSRVLSLVRLEEWSQEDQEQIWEHECRINELREDSLAAGVKELIQRSSEGNPRKLKQLLRTAWIVASESGSTEIKQEHAQEAVESQLWTTS